MKKALFSLWVVVSLFAAGTASADSCSDCFQGCAGFCASRYGDNAYAQAACFGGCGYACANFVCE